MSNTMKRRIYVASSWRNAYQPDVVGSLRAAGHEVYDFRNPPGRSGFGWEELAPDWQTWSNEAYVQHLQHPIAQAGFASDFNAMKWADTCVLVLPSGRSAHLEGGYFADRDGKSLYILQVEPQEPELMYLMADRICLGVDELVGALAGETNRG